MGDILRCCGDYSTVRYSTVQHSTEATVRNNRAGHWEEAVAAPPVATSQASHLGGGRGHTIITSPEQSTWDWRTGDEASTKILFAHYLPGSDQ